MLSTDLSTGIALCALVVALIALGISWRRYGAPRRSLRMINEIAADQAYDIQSLRSSIKKLNARVGMREARDAKKENGAADVDPKDYRQQPTESVAEWKARCRAAIASGALKHGD